MKSFDITGCDEQRIAYFRCKCGSDEFERPPEMAQHKCFFVGYFVCSKCKKQFDYGDREFRTVAKQQELF
jgi:hypothetical protein